MKFLKTTRGGEQTTKFNNRVKLQVRNSELKLSVNGLIMMLRGASFWLFPELFTLVMFPSVAKIEQALGLGNALRKNIGVGCIFISLVLA